MHVGEPIVLIVADIDRRGARRGRTGRDRLRSAAARHAPSPTRLRPVRRSSGRRLPATSRSTGRCRRSRRAARRRRRDLPDRRACRARRPWSTSASRCRRWSRAARRRATTRQQDRYALRSCSQGRDLVARATGRRHGRERASRSRCDRRRRRRVRHEDVGLSGIHRAAGRRAPDRTAGALDVGSHGSLSHRQPGARHGHRRRARARCQGQVSRAARQASGRPGRLYRGGRRQHPDDEFRALLSLRLRHSEDVDRRALRVHQRAADRALSRRRPARGELRHGAAGRGGRAGQRHRCDRRFAAAT